VEQGEGCRRDYVEGDDEESWNFVRVELNRAAGYVQEKKYEEGAGSVIFAVVFDRGRMGEFYAVATRMSFGRGWLRSRYLGEDFSEMHRFGGGVLGDLFGAAEAVGDEDGVGGFVADGGEQDPVG
jgi:hypothetical protein